MPQQNWTHEQSEQLRTLWATGLSESAIGARMGFHKSAVHGRARRMGLPTRGNPTKRPRTVFRPSRAGAVTLPPLASLR